MSTSLLYHTMSIRGYMHIRTDYQEGEVIFTISQPRRRCRCPVCGSAAIILKGGEERQWRNVPIGSRPTWIRMRIPRVLCRSCNSLRQVAVDFADPLVRYTKAFARYALELCRSMTIQDVALHLRVSWDVIKEIYKRDLQQRFARPKLKDLRQIAIDEIAAAKGHRYLTVAMDLESGAVVYVGDGKGGDALTAFWTRLRHSGAKIRAVAIDMSPAYIEAVLTFLPKAKIVFDRFHVMKLYNAKLSDLRREAFHEVKDTMQKKVLKGTRWLLLKSAENLDDDRQERERLEEALRLNQPLATAYYLKEELRLFWEQKNRRKAAAFLEGWIRRAESTSIRMLHQIAKTLRLHRSGLLSFYRYPISTGPLEGTNNKIKTMKRMAYGFRDHEFFKLKIYALHEARYALVG
jgi:transposase